MPVRLIEPASEEPVSLEDVKTSLRVDHDDDDDMLARYIASARDWVERRVQEKFATQTWELVLDEFPDENIELPFGPVQEIVSIKYDDTDLIEQTLDPASYRLGGSGRDHYVVPIDDWPTAYEGDSVRVRFVAGYDTSSPQSEFVPSSIEAAIIFKVMEMYESADVASQIDNLLTNHLRIEA